MGQESGVKGRVRSGVKSQGNVQGQSEDLGLGSEDRVKVRFMMTIEVGVSDQGSG